MGLSVQDIITNAARAAAQNPQKTSTQRFRYKATGGAIGVLTGDSTPDVKPGAVTSTDKRKSGYAADLHPDLLDAAEKSGLATPPAGDNGAQRGRVSPAMIRPTAHYEPVDMDEAMRRANLRRKGAMPPIEGGLNDPKVINTKAPMDQYEDNAMEAGDDPATINYPVIKGEAKLLTLDSAEATAAKLPNDVEVQRNAVAQLSLSKRDLYFAKRTRVSFIMPNGTYAVPAIDVRIETNGVIILLPSGGNDATFIPNAGSRFGIVHEGKQIDCYFPGTVFTLDTLNITILALLKDTKEDAHDRTNSPGDGGN